MKKNNSAFTFLISETTLPTEITDKREDYVVDGGVKIPIIRWKQVLSNTAKETENGNLFTQPELQEASMKPIVTDRLNGNAFFSEFQHPTRSDPERYMMVYDEKVSHRINKFYFENVNGDICFCGDLETATYAYGPDLRKKIISGAIPAMSLRAAGTVEMQADGSSKKDLRLIAYDNVFCASDRHAWGKDTSFEKSYYSEAINIDDINANRSAIAAYRSANVESIKGIFRPLDKGLNLIAESFNGYTPKQIIYKTEGNKGIIGFYSESMSLKTTIEDKKLINDMNAFFRGI